MYAELIGIGGLVVALIGVITGFILQRDQKRMRDLERENKKYKARLLKALHAIHGYQQVEHSHAQDQDMSVAAYRRKVRKQHPELFNTAFLTPKNVREMMHDLEQE